MHKRQHTKERFFLGLRWRGRLNLKDITERFISSFLSGFFAGLTFFLLVTFFGGL